MGAGVPRIFIEAQPGNGAGDRALELDTKLECVVIVIRTNQDRGVSLSPGAHRRRIKQANGCSHPYRDRDAGPVAFQVAAVIDRSGQKLIGARRLGPPEVGPTRDAARGISGGRGYRMPGEAIVSRNLDPGH